MKVKDLMTIEPRICSPQTTVAEAAHLMWEADCGVLPVLDQGRLLGVVTDRDMYIALATRNVLPSQLTVGEVARRNVVTANANDDVHAAVATMKRAHVRRLPVLDERGAVVGILSLDDLVLAAGSNKVVRNNEVVEALQAIVTHHRLPVPVATH